MLLLSAALGMLDDSPLFSDIVHNQGESIRPCRGVRGAYVYRLAGYPVPDDWHVSEPSWD